MKGDYPSEKRVYGSIVAWTLALAALVAVVVAATWGWRYVTAPAKGRIEAREQINSGGTRIAAYNHFFDMCAAVQTVEQTLLAEYQERKTADTAKDRERINTNITGLQAERARSINEYNADARKSYTIGQFRSSSLPYQLNASPFTATSEVTSCDV